MRSAAINVIVLTGLLALVPGVRADEQKVPLKDVPKAVLDAVKDKFPGAELTGAGKETEDGKTLFEISLKDKGQKVDVAVTAEGTIEEIEKEIASKDLPTPVASALAAKYPGASIKKAEVIVQIKGGKETKSYEVVVVTEAKKTLEVKLSPAGKILEQEEEGKG
jgi:hypothetical protein